MTPLVTQRPRARLDLLFYLPTSKRILEEEET